MASPKTKESIFVFNGNHDYTQDREYTEIERLGRTHWESDYACDIFKSMLEQEQRRRPLQYLSLQMSEREEAMQLMQRVTRTFKLSRGAFHLAMYYLDRLADQYKIRADKFPLVGLVCLHIGAQIEHTDALIPRYSEMNHFVRDSYTAAEYKVVERKILFFFNFEMIRPTTVSFVELFSCTFLTRTDYQDYIRMLDDYEMNQQMVPYQRYESFEEMLVPLAQLLLRLSNCTLSITAFGNVAPSLLAAACIASVRQLNGVKRWSQYLVNLTTYTEDQVESYSETINMFHYYQIAPPPAPVSVPEPDKKEELPICDYTAGQSNQNWSSPDSGFEEHLTASTDSKEPLTAGTDFKEPLTAGTDFKEHLTAGTDFKEPLTAGTDFRKLQTAGTDSKDLLTVTKDSGEALTLTKDLKEPLSVEFVVLDNVTTLEVETYSIITVQMQEPASTEVKSDRDIKATLKRRRQEDGDDDDAESGSQPYKQPKLMT